jgi:hypothetical protein
MFWLPLSIIAIDMAETISDPEVDGYNAAGAASSYEGLKSRLPGGSGQDKRSVNLTTRIKEMTKGVEMTGVMRAVKGLSSRLEVVFHKVRDKWGSNTVKVLQDSADRAMQFNGDKIKLLAEDLRKKVIEKTKDISLLDAATVVWLIHEIVNSPEKTGSALLAIEESALGEVAKDVSLDSALIATILTTKDDLERLHLMKDLSLKLGLSLDQLYLMILISVIAGHMDTEKINLTGIDKIVMIEKD